MSKQELTALPLIGGPGHGMMHADRASLLYVTIGIEATQHAYRKHAIRDALGREYRFWCPSDWPDAKLIEFLIAMAHRATPLEGEG